MPVLLFCPFVCHHDYPKTTDPMFLKFVRVMGHGQEKSLLKFGIDQNGLFKLDGFQICMS